MSNNGEKVSASGYLCPAIFHANNFGLLLNHRAIESAAKEYNCWNSTNIFCVGWVSLHSTQHHQHRLPPARYAIEYGLNNLKFWASGRWTDARSYSSIVPLTLGLLGFADGRPCTNEKFVGWVKWSETQHHQHRLPPARYAIEIWIEYLKFWAAGRWRAGGGVGFRFT